MLRIAGQEERVEEWLRPIPFPRNRFKEQPTEPVDSVQMVEAALDRVQSDLDEVNRFMSGPLPFPVANGDDGPSAA